MTTQYNAMATVPISTTTVINEKIQKTSDCFQVTFTTAPDLTPIWRTVIKRRYFDGLNESKYFHSTWADYARINGKRVLVDASKVNDYDLFQSTLQVYLTTGPEDQKRPDKLLTVHIYHTNGKKSVRTVLVQGFRCPQWVESEFEAIKRCVHGIALLYTSQSCMLKAALTANIQKALMPPGEEAPAVSSSDRTPGNTDALPISPSSSHDNGAESMTTITPSSSSDAQRELETTHTSSSSKDVMRELVTSSPSSDTLGMPMNTTPSSPLYNAREKEETTPTLSPSVDARGEEETTPTLESPSDNVHREQENTPTLSPSDDDLREQEMNCTIEQLRAELVAVKASQKADREHFKIEINSLNVIINNMKSAIQEMKAKLKLNKDRKQCNNCQLKQVAPHTSTTSATSKPQAVDRVWQETPKTGSQHPTNSNTKNNSSKPSNRRDEHHHRSNKDQCLTISPDTTLLYIGDSVLDGLHAEKMGCSERDHAQVTISPGLTVTSLISSLSSRVQQSKKVTCVNVHVGINDCVNGRFIKKETWTSVINALRRCFPSAAVNLSSILPLNDTNKHVANCINKTNDGMYHAAWEKGAFFTDNDETFYSRSWEVKSSWYLNGFRPNKRGSSGLARNLKRTVQLSKHRPSEKSSQQRPTTYQPTPAYVSYVPKDYRSHQRAHQSPPPHHQHGHPTTASNSPAHHTSPANIQDRRAYSDVVSYGSAKTHPSQAYPEAYDQSRVTSQIQNQQAASLVKQPHLATPPIQQMYLSMVQKLIEFGKVLHVQ